MNHAIFRETNPRQIEAQGHLHELLARQQQGVGSHFLQQGYPFNTAMWNGGIDNVLFSSPVYRDVPREVPAAEAWWPYEQSAYLLDGLLRLGILMHDEAKIQLVRENLEYVLAHPDERGVLGHFQGANRSEWPMTVFFRAVAVYYEFSGDARIVAAFHRHYSALTVEELAIPFRHVTNLEGLLKTYEWTGDEALLKKAEDAYLRHNAYYQAHYEDENELNFDKLTSGKNYVMHGVSFSEEVKLPVLLSIYTGKRSYLEGAIAGLENVLRRHEQLPGLPSSNEYFSGRDPLQGYEMCVISDFMWALGYFLMATGDGAYADRLEKIAYNALPGATDADWNTLQYLSSPNQVIAAPESNHTGFFHGISPWRQYRTNHFPQCCPGNVHRALPNFVLRLWLEGNDGMPVAALYGPSVFSGCYHGHSYRIEEETRYPYDGEVQFHFCGDIPEAMPFAFRIPAWCSRAQVYLNGVPIEVQEHLEKYLVIRRSWQAGDTVTLQFEMSVRRCHERNWEWLEWGTLLFSLPIAAQPDNREPGAPENLRLYPASPWNYMLSSPEAEIQVKFHADGKCWSTDLPPVTLHCRGRRVSHYDTLARQRFTPPVPLFAIPQGGEEALTLVPFGATMLRVTAFPDGKKRQLVPIYQVYAIGSFPYDFRVPLAEQSFWPETLTPEEFRQRAAPVQVDECGYYNLQHHFGHGKDRVAYVQLQIWADTPGRATLALGASQGAQGWLGGRHCVALEELSAAELFAPQWFELTLEAGYNDLILKVCEGYTPSQYRKAWGVYPIVFVE